MISPHRVKKVKRIKRIRRWKKRSLFVLFAFIFLISFLLVFMYTSLGVKLTTTVLEKVMPEIQIQRISGTLYELELDGFSMTLDGVEVKVGKAELSLSGLCLVKGKICVKNFVADDVLVNVYTDAFAGSEIEEPIEQSTARTIINMPLPIELRQANLTRVSVNVDDMHFGLSSFTGKATWINEKIYVYPVVAQKVVAIFPDSQPVDVKKDREGEKKSSSISDSINDIFNKPLIASLPNVNIPLDVYVSSLKGDNWLLHIGGEDFHFNQVAISGNTTNNIITVKSLQTSAKTPYANGNVSINGKIILGDNWPISAKVYAKTEPFNKSDSTEITSNISGQLLGQLGTTIQIKGFNQANIDAKVDFIQTYMPVTVKASGKMIQWPILGEADYQLKNFAVDLSGGVKDYHFDAKGDFYGKQLPTVLFDVQSTGSNESINIKTLAAKLPQGEFVMAGKLNWLKGLQWDAAVNFDKIDLSQQLPNYPIKLDGQLKTNGSFDEKSWLANLTEMQINGSVNHAPLHASGTVAINSSQFISAEQLKIKWGNNYIDLNGSSKQGNLIANLNFSELQVIQADLQGGIVGNLTFNGSVYRPIINSNLVIKQFAWQDIQLNQAQLTGLLAYHDLLKGHIELKAKQFVMPNLSIDKANIALSGDETNHHLIITSEGEPVSTAIDLVGHLNKQWTKWQGTLAEATLTFNEKNRWQINKPVLLQYNLATNQGSIAAHCWLNGPSQMCIDQNIIIADRGEASITLSDIDLKLFEIINQGETNIAGTVHGNAKVKWGPQYNIPSIVANIKSTDVYVRQQIASQTLPIPFDLFAINLTVNDAQAKLDWNFSIKEFGRFIGNINVDDPVNTKRLSGQLSIEELSLSIINPLLNNNEHADGVINGNLKFSGTLLDPYIVGNLDLEHSEIKTTQLPADIQSLMIDVDFNGKSSVLKGQMKTKAGIVDIDGGADWQNIENWNAHVTVKGAAIEVSMPPMITMSVVPNIRVEANQHQLDLTGKITIPTAKIKVESLPPSTVDVSADEVMLNSNLQEIAPQHLGMKINTKVLVSLGDKVNIDAFGLVARLAGNVYVTQTDKGLTVNGQINIPQGRFQAYGQDLIVRKGEIIFAGPADQPRLNIEAIRNPESIENNVVAGIRVTGLADDPKAEVFSDPAMSQQDALSYLLRGQGLDSGEQSENDMMTALLIGLGTAQGGKIIGSIGDTFGIKNLSLDTQGVGNSQKVVVSGYILPKLQLKYGVGIFDSLATFTLRYRLLPRLYLEAVSGVDQTVDLIYQFEF